ncbi:MAG: MFS transporter [Sulfurimonas sp.]
MKHIDKNVLMLGWVSYFTDMATAMIQPILPLFIVLVLHEGMDKLGFIVAVATFVSYAMRLLSGYLSDRYGIVKPFVVGGYGLSALTKPLIGLTGNYQQVTVLQSLERLGKGLRSAPKDLMIAAYSKENASGKTFGFHKMLDIAGELSGTLILFGLLAIFGQSEGMMRSIFYVTLVPGLIGLAIMVLWVQDIPKPSQREKLKFTFSDKDKQTVKALFVYFFFVFFMFSAAFFTVQAKEVGIETALIPLLFVVSTGIQTATSYTIGRWIDKIGVKRIMLFAYLSGVIAQLLLYLQNPLSTWLAFAFLGLFTVASFNANRAYIADRAENRGSVYGIFYAGVALFGAVGAYIGGVIWEYFGMHAALGYSLVGTLMVLVFFGVIVRNGK